MYTQGYTLLTSLDRVTLKNNKHLLHNMGVPEFIRQIIDDHKYSFVLGQTLVDRNVNSKPTISFIDVRKNGTTLCTIIYDCETKSTKIENAGVVGIAPELSDYLKSTLVDVGQEVWLKELKPYSTYPEPLEEFFKLGIKYWQ